MPVYCKITFGFSTLLSRTIPGIEITIVEMLKATATEGQTWYSSLSTGKMENTSEWIGRPISAAMVAERILWLLITCTSFSIGAKAIIAADSTTPATI